MLDWRLALAKDGEIVRDSKGEQIGYRRGDELRSVGGELVGTVRDNGWIREVRNARGELVYTVEKSPFWNAEEVRNARGELVGYRHASEEGYIRNIQGVYEGEAKTERW